MSEQDTSPVELAPTAYALAVHTFGRNVSLRLLLWSALSMAGGALLWRRGAPFWRGVGAHAVGWGAIDALIALSGLRPGRQPSPDPTRAARNLRRLLWFNAVLDVGYMAGGVRLARGKGRDDANWRGQGWGIVVQGAFLFVFDLVHARRVPRPAPVETDA
jgi:hypothetical protein